MTTAVTIDVGTRISNAISGMLKIFKCNISNTEGFERSLKAKNAVSTAADDYLRVNVDEVNKRISERVRNAKIISIKPSNSSVSGSDIPLPEADRNK